RATIIHPYLAHGFNERVVMVEGSGCRLQDADGKRYLDATGGLWLAQVGHGRREIAEAASRQMQKLEYFVSFWEFTNEPAIELAERLVALSPERQTHVYFTSGGSEGNRNRSPHGSLLSPSARRQRTNLDLGAEHGIPRCRLRLRICFGLPLYHEGFG
ncbi:aminotransferase class-III, partial [mine drainage metagenome]